MNQVPVEATAPAMRAQQSPTRPSKRKDVAVFGVVAAFALALIWLGIGPFMLGPCDWDDTLYVDAASEGRYEVQVRNRYTHIWALRVVQEVVESRRTAAAVWPALLVAALAVMGFFAGRRCGGTACGLLAMALVALFPPMLKYVGVPHVDLTLAVMSMACVLAAVSAARSETRLRAGAAALASGLSCLLALETKETALVLPPLALYLLTGARGSKLRIYGAWLAGLALGWCVLMGLDALFLVSGQTWSSDLREYFPRVRVPAELTPGWVRGPAPKPYLGRELLDELSKPPSAAFIWMGLAGAAHGFRSNPWVKALTLWGLATLVFTAVVAAHSQTIDGQDRYLICIGAALAPLSAAWVVGLWRRPGEERRDNLSWLLPLLLLLATIAFWSLSSFYFGQSGTLARRTVFFVVPVAMLVLFLTPWLTGSRAVATAAAAILLAISAFASIGQARKHIVHKRGELAPWIGVVRGADAAGAQLAVWKPDKKLGPQRVLWRVRALSSRSAADVRVRLVDNPGEAHADEWLFTRAERGEALDSAQWQHVASGGPPQWSVYRRRGAFAPARDSQRR